MAKLIVPIIFIVAMCAKYGVVNQIKLFCSALFVIFVVCVVVVIVQKIWGVLFHHSTSKVSRKRR